MLEGPHNVEAEQALLGSILVNNNIFPRVSGFLKAEHFAEPVHRRLFDVLARMIDGGQAATPITVKTHVEQDPELLAKGGTKYVVDLLAASVHPVDAEQFGGIIADLHKRRKLIEVAGAVIAAARTPWPDTSMVESLRRELELVSTEGAAARPSLDHVQAHTLAGTPVPRRRWIAVDWIPVHQVTLLSGDGGIGKSLLALQLMVATASGTPWIGLAVERVGSFGLFAEDDDAELHHRLADVCRAAGVEVGDLHDMAWRSAVVDPCELVEMDDRGAIVPTAYFRRLEQTVVHLGSRLVVLDAATNLFGGDEIRRRHVNQFLVLLRQLAIRIDGAVVLLAHPSVQGMQAKTGMSGSTHWNNGVRSRLYFRAGADKGDDEEDGAETDVRTLARMKANHAPAGGTIKVRWEAGAFRPVSEPDFVDRIELDGKADRVFLKLLGDAAALGQNVSPTPTSNNYGPTLFAKNPSRDGVTKKAFETAMHRLVKGGAVTIQTYGRPSEPRTRLSLGAAAGHAGGGSGA